MRAGTSSRVGHPRVFLSRHRRNWLSLWKPSIDLGQIASVAALRTHAEASAARRRGEDAEAARQERLAASYRAMRDAYQAHEAVLGKAIRDRRASEHDTIGSQLSSGHGAGSQPPGAAIAATEASRLVRELALRLGRAGPAIPLGPAQRRTAILRPPALEIPPSSWILERAADRDPEPEAAG